MLSKHASIHGTHHCCGPYSEVINSSAGGDGWDNDDVAFDAMEDEQQREIEERMKRLNTRSTQKARPPRPTPSRDGGLERQNSLDSEASMASSQSYASNVTLGEYQQSWPLCCQQCLTCKYSGCALLPLSSSMLGSLPMFRKSAIKIFSSISVCRGTSLFLHLMTSEHECRISCRACWSRC